MKLAKPFFHLPVRFDVERLRQEVAALPSAAWANHPNDIRGNTSLRLISVDGGDNDDVDGIMLPTPHLQASPYLRQVLASFGVVWSRSRLLKLAPLAGVPQHADINYHWFNRVRLHVPIHTHPDVRFHCGDRDVHMEAGHAWIFDNWRLHRVDNPVNAERIHLVADTSGSASFWQFAGLDDSATVAEHRFDAARNVTPLTEQTPLRPVMPPAEVDLLVLDLQAELTPTDDGGTDMTRRYAALLDAFRRDWRQLYQLFGETPAGSAEYTKLRDSVRAASKELAVRLMMRTNRVPAHAVLEGRILRAVLTPRPAPSEAAIRLNAATATRAAGERRPRGRRLTRPLFIVAAPRSGSTLLFETLAASQQLCTVGGEAHWLIEGLAELRPGAPNVDSNRLDARHFSSHAASWMEQHILAQLRDHRGRPLDTHEESRFLEKTPKNVLRVPFLDRAFPEAQFIFLWRDPRENLSSIIEAWKSGDWKTYNGLAGFDGPWSLVLPPGWQAMSGKNLEEIAAFQWEACNRIALDDLQALPRERWTHLDYAALCGGPESAIRRLCNFAGLDFDPGLAARVHAPLPLSRFTQTPPAVDKWRQNEAAVTRVLPLVNATWKRLREMQ